MPRNFSTFADAPLGGRHGLVLLVVLVVVVGLGAVAAELRLRVHLRDALERRSEPRQLAVHVARLLGSAGDDQRRARLVDQDVVDLVHDAERVAALHDLLQRAGHVVAQVVEAELRVGAEGDVGGIGLAPLLGAHVVLDHADLHAEHVVDGPHPVGVAAGQVVVHRHEVHALAGERVQEHRERGRESLALAGLHLGDRPVVEHHAADHLHVVVAHAERALAGLAAEREGLVQQVVQRLALAPRACAAHRPPRGSRDPRAARSRARSR